MPGSVKSQSVLVFIITLAIARSASAQTSSVENISAYLKASYYREMAGQLRVYNGIKYVDYNAYYVGNAYFNNTNFQNTTLYYDGSKFENVPALYDMYRETVVVKYKDTSDKISLINAKLDSFNMSGHRFIHVDEEGTTKPGFYELLYEGKTQLLKKYTVNIEDDKSEGVTKHRFYQNATYYLYRNGVYSSISGGSALLSQLKDKRKQLNEYLSVNKLGRKLTEEEMAKLLLYYDKLNG